MENEKSDVNLCVNQESQKNIALSNLQKKIKSVLTTENYLSSYLNLEEQAVLDCFYERSPRKITATAILLGFAEMIVKGANDLSMWCNEMGKILGVYAREASMQERLEKPACEQLFKHVLETALNKSHKRQKLNKISKKALKKLGGLAANFNNIFIQDSVLQSVSHELYEHLGGANSTSSNPKAQFRIQCMYNLSTQNWQSIEVFGYHENDQSKAKWQLDMLEKNDLLIRDRGYFTLEALEQLIDNQYFISLWDHRTYLYDLNGTALSILDVMADKRKSLDMPILLGAAKRLPMRLIVRRLSDAAYSKKIAKLKQEQRHSKTNHDETYLELMRFEIYITNIPMSIAGSKQIAQLYGLRWKIETLFKSWKSYFGFRQVFQKYSPKGTVSEKKMSPERTMVSVYLLLILLVCIANIFQTFFEQELEDKLRQTSCYKFTKWVKANVDIFFKIVSLEELTKYQVPFKLYALYQKRADRDNMSEKYNKIIMGLT